MGPALLLLFLSAGCRHALPVPAAPVPVLPEASATPREATVTGFAMGGELRVVLRCVQEQAACLAQGVAARAEVERIEALATDWSERGEIARLDAQGQATVSPEVQALLQASLRVARATRGAFDPTINALWGLYDFDAGREPSAETLAARLPLIDWQGLQLDGDQARLRPGQSVTLGGIAQGYAAAQALALLPGEAMVDLSGDIAVRGAWQVGIQHPRRPRGDALASLTLQDAVLTTSGDYEHFFMVGDRRVHHILDPRTGRPATGATSATVVHPDGAVADALATALLVLGPDPGPVQALGAWALVVTPDGAVHELGDSGAHVRELRLLP